MCVQRRLFNLIRVFVVRMKNFCILGYKNCTPIKILIRLCKFAGWSESTLNAHVRRYVWWPCGLYEKREKRALNPMWTAKIRSACANNARPSLFVGILVFRACNRTKRPWVVWPCVNEQSDLYAVALWHIRMDTLHRCKKSLCPLL